MTKNEIDFILTDKPNIFQDVKVLNKVNVGSDHRMLLGKIKINTQSDKNSSEQNQTILMWRNWEKVERNFKFENQFQLLHDEHKEIDANMYEWNEQIVEAIHKTLSKIAGKKKKTHSNKIQTVPES